MHGTNTPRQSCYRPFKQTRTFPHGRQQIGSGNVQVAQYLSERRYLVSCRIAATSPSDTSTVACSLYAQLRKTMGIMRSNIVDKFVHGRRIPFQHGVFICPDCFQRCRTTAKMSYHLDNQKVSSRTGHLKCPRMPDEKRIQALEKKRLRESLALHLHRIPCTTSLQQAATPACACASNPHQKQTSAEPEPPTPSRSGMGCGEDGCLGQPMPCCASGGLSKGGCNDAPEDLGTSRADDSNGATVADYAAHFLETVMGIDDDEIDTLGDVLQSDLIDHLQARPIPPTAPTAVLSIDSTCTDGGPSQS